MTEEELMLYKILNSRELRWKKQKNFIRKFQCSLVSFTLNIPGGQKDSQLYRKTHREGLKLLLKIIHEKNMKVINKEVVYKDTGPEAYISVQSEAYKLKALTIDFEESNPLGRIYDIDVLDKNFAVISRKGLSFKERKCFLCDDTANNCRRMERHTIEELTDYINKLICDYFRLDK